MYDRYWLPDGGKLFAYSSDKRHSIGAFTSINNKGSKKSPQGFASGLIYSDNIVLEYYQPKGVTEKVIISIEYVVHGYRYIHIPVTRSLGESGNCQVNINCEEGRNWQNEKNAVALILVDGNRYCTGSLINTTANDNRPLFLTADHCLGGWANSVKYDAINHPNITHYSFYWHYEHPTCSNSPTEPVIRSTVGATVVANNSSSDFALIRLTENPANSSNITPYYLGWDRSGNSGTGGVGIHHPSGDVKKIATLNHPTTNNSDGNYNYWRHYWDSTTNGYSVTEGGSSGSPLINNSRHIIGQLRGGSSINCSNPSQDFAVYGKFNVSWTGNNATDARRRLKDWLDPLNTNPQTLNGIGTYGNLSISGPTTICDQATYTIENLPAGTTVEWSATGNAQLVSGQGIGVATFSKTGNGAATIKVTINGAVVLEKEVWVGITLPLDIRVVDPNGNYVYVLVEDKEQHVSLDYIGSNQQVDYWDWKVSGGYVSYIDSDHSSVILTPINQDFKALIRAHNTCGTSGWFTILSGAINGDNPPWNAYYLITPNGDGFNDTWEIGTTEKPEGETTALRSSETYVPVYNITIFNSQGAMVYKKKNYMQDHERFYGMGNTGGYVSKVLPDGNYFFMIKGSVNKSGYLYIKRE